MRRSTVRTRCGTRSGGSRSRRLGGTRRLLRHAVHALPLLLARDGAAADVISADRPGVANPPSVVAPGTLQFEGGLQVESETDDGGDPDTVSYTLPDGVLRVGLIHDLELRLEADGFVFLDRKGASNQAVGSDLVLAAKWRLRDQAGLLPAFAVLPALSLPTGGDSVTSDGFDPSLDLLGEWALAERWSLTSNLGFAAPTQGVDDPRRVFALAPSVSLGFAITARWNAFVEYYGALNTGGVSDQHSVDGGFSWLADDNLQLDLSAGGGLDAAAPDWFVSAGFAWRFRPWRR